jgi:hypothetical protein
MVDSLGLLLTAPLTSLALISAIAESVLRMHSDSPMGGRQEGTSARRVRPRDLCEPLTVTSRGHATLGDHAGNAGYLWECMIDSRRAVSYGETLRVGAEACLAVTSLSKDTACPAGAARPALLADRRFGARRNSNSWSVSFNAAAYRWAFRRCWP